MRSGFDYITSPALYGHSEAMQALHEHACNWLLTVDCLAYPTGLTIEEAIRVADAGFIGEDVRKARKLLATLA